MSPSDDTRSRLLDAAGQVFADKGFESATVREICQLADANIAAVNYYFGDKEKLYIDSVREAQCARAELAPMPDWPAQTPAQECLRIFVQTFIARLLAPGRPQWHRELMLRELAHPTQACTEIVRDYIRPMADVLGMIVDRLLKPASPFQRHELVCFSVVGQCLFYYVHTPIIRELMGEEYLRSLEMDHLVDHITRFTLAAVGASSLEDSAIAFMPGGES
jgi:AcrR family transcriptional regulator